MHTRHTGFTIALLSLTISILASTATACQAGSGISSEQNTMAAQLRQQLQEKGWRAVPADDGSTYYLPPNPQMTTPQRPSQKNTLAGQLRAQLKERGWTSVPAKDGGIYYLQPQPEKTEPPTPEQKPSSTKQVQEKTGPSTPPQDQSLAGQLRKELNNKGWTAITAEDGSIYYVPPGIKYRVYPVHPNPVSLGDRLREQLEGMGWTAAPAGDGSVYYRPPQEKASPPPIPASPDSSKSEQPLPAKNDAIGAGVDTPPAPESSSVATIPAGTSGTSSKKPEGEVAQGSNDESPGIEPEEKMATEEAAGGTKPARATPPARPYRNPPPYPYGWPLYPAPAYQAPYSAPPAWQSSYRPTRPGYGQPRQR